MKIRINGCDNDLKIGEQSISVIQVKDIKLFRKILDNINQKINEIENNDIFILDDKEGEISFSKEVFILFDLFNIDFSSKKILTKMYNKIQDTLNQDEEIEFADKLVEVRGVLVRHANELPFNYKIKEEIKLVDVLKLFEFKIDEQSYQSILEKLELFIDILSTLNISRFLIIPNLKDYLIEEEIIYLYKYSLYNNINLIIIQNSEKKKLEYERKLIIDENFIDFID